MKTKIYLIALVLISTLISCDSEQITYTNDFESSLKTLQDFKATSNNSYTYTVVKGSWVGISWKTIITVSNGKVIQRAFAYTQVVENSIPENELEWTENSTDLGSHVDSPASSVLTLDEIYDLAKTDWLIERANSKIYFENQNNGMISSCGYIPNNCADDCFFGININSITALELKK